MTDRSALWDNLARQLRADCIRSTTAAGSGHATSGMSAADLMAVLLSDHLRFDVDRPDRPENDRLIFSKGHACPLLYAMFKAAGAISDAELLTLRKADSRIEGHPTPRLPFIDVATGSLGQGLAAGVGMALAARRDARPSRVWVLLGDSECAEGSVYEAFAAAAYRQLGNLVAVIDVNRLGQSGQTMLGWDTGHYRARAEAFGWRAVEIDGHDLNAIDAAYRVVGDATGRIPLCIIARTKKGRGVTFVENAEGWHGKALSREEAERALAELRAPDTLFVRPQPPPVWRKISAREHDGDPALPRYPLGSSIATRRAYGDALKALGDAREDVVVLDAEVSNSTYSDMFKKAHPDRFIEMYIAEQCMLGVALGLWSSGHRAVFASTFAAFFTRAFDQIRMAAVSRATLHLCGSHAGVSIGEDGPSQMGLEDIAMMRTVHGSTVLYPSDANATAHLVAAVADREGITYLRTTREKTAVIYDPDESFPIGGSKVLRQSASDQATIVAAGITLHEALKAAEQMDKEGIKIRVVDCYSIKPIDAEVLRRAAQETGHLVVVEDHWHQGGLGDAVLAALADIGQPVARFSHLAVREMPSSATPEEQLDRHHLSARHILEQLSYLRLGTSVR